MAILDHSNSMQVHNVHRLHKRDIPISTVSPTATLVSEGVGAEPSVSAVAHHHHGPTTAEKAIAAVIVIVGVAILAGAAWWIGKRRRQKVRAASTKFNVSLMQQNGGEKAIPIDFDSTGKELEKPNMKFPLPTTPLASVKRSSTSRPWTHTLPMEVPTFPPEQAGSLIRSPPPSYATANGTASPPSHRVPPPALEIPLQPKSGHVVVPSPRSSSFGVDSPLYHKAPLTAWKMKSGLATASKPLPRMMVVESTFKPALTDELLIQVGETLNMLEEYEDEWCLVQRGSSSGQKGVVPRFCLREKA